jgi:hypothetical protein
MSNHNPNRHPSAAPPPLSKSDRQRLRLYLEDCREDAAALARACGMDYLDILDWLDSPACRVPIAQCLVPSP